MMTLECKMKILDQLAKGVRISSLARQFHVNESTIRSIRGCERAIREKAFNLGIREPRSPLSRNLFPKEDQQNSRTSAENVSADSDEVASSCDNFKNHLGLYNVKMEETELSDHNVTTRYLEEFNKYIQIKGYKPQQVFNADETGLFWKCMPNWMFLANGERAEKTENNLLSLILCANASGDCVIKPLLVHQTLNPHALQGKIKNHLPVFWRADNNALVTAALFMDWFHNCFVHEVQRYLKDCGLDFKVLLILDHSSSHLRSLQFAHPNVEVIFLPPKATFQLQPMSQGVTKIFKACYTRHTFDYIADLLEKNPGHSLQKAWEGFNIAHALTIIKESLDELKPCVLNTAWRNIWEEVVDDVKDVPSLHDEVNRVLMSLTRLPGDGFINMQLKDITELLDSHTEHQVEEEMASRDAEEKEDADVNIKITLSDVNELMSLATKLVNKAMKIDPFLERSITFKQTIEDALKPYKELKRDLQIKAAHPVLHSFFTNV